MPATFPHPLVGLPLAPTPTKPPEKKLRGAERRCMQCPRTPAATQAHWNAIAASSYLEPSRSQEGQVRNPRKGGFGTRPNKGARTACPYMRTGGRDACAPRRSMRTGERDASAPRRTVCAGGREAPGSAGILPAPCVLAGVPPALPGAACALAGGTPVRPGAACMLTTALPSKCELVLLKKDCIPRSI